MHSEFSKPVIIIQEENIVLVYAASLWTLLVLKII